MFKEANVIDVNHYCYTVAWSEEDQAYVARVAEFPSLAAHGNSAAAALKEIQSVVSLVVQELAESKEPVPLPFSMEKLSGKFNVRVPESMHRALKIKAALEGVSLNQFINVNLGKALSDSPVVLSAATAGIHISGRTIPFGKSSSSRRAAKRNRASKKSVGIK